MTEVRGFANVDVRATGNEVNRRFPLFDSLRAVAALCVLVTHAAFVSGAIFTAPYRFLLVHLNVGVTIFFVISGFLLYRPYVAARRAGQRPVGLSRYALRRFFRIFPAYWLALAVLGIYPGLYGAFTGNWWVYHGLLQIYPIYKIGPDCVTKVQGCGLVQTWSLAIEVSFYVALPLFAFLMGQMTARRSRRTWLGWETFVLVGFSVLSMFVNLGSLAHPRFQWLHSSIFANFSWFAIGMGLAVASVALSDREERSRLIRLVVRWPSVTWVSAAGLFVFLGLWLPLTANPMDFTTTQRVAEHLLFGLIAALLLLPAIFGDGTRGVVRRGLANPLLSWLGRISYGIFLWHLVITFKLAEVGVLSLPGNRFLNLTVATLVVSAAVAAISYYAVETPLIRMTHRRGKSHAHERASVEASAGDKVPGTSLNAAEPTGARSADALSGL